jgi:hypothetical protein
LSSACGRHTRSYVSIHIFLSKKLGLFCESIQKCALLSKCDKCRQAHSIHGTLNSCLLKFSGSLCQQLKSSAVRGKNFSTSCLVISVRSSFEKNCWRTLYVANVTGFLISVLTATDHTVRKDSYTTMTKNLMSKPIAQHNGFTKS